MLSLPWKPTRKLKISELAEGHYLITFVSGIANETAFKTTINDDLASCLNEEDHLLNADWSTKSVELITPNIKSFKKRVIFESLVIVNE